MSTILDDLANKEGGIKELGCRVGKATSTLNNYRSSNKDNIPALMGYGTKLAYDLFLKTNRAKAHYQAVDDGILVEVKITRL